MITDNDTGVAEVFMGNFKYPSICWKDFPVKQSKRLLQSADDNLLTQVLKELTREWVLLDLVLTNKEGLIGDTKVDGSFSCSDHEMVEFRVLQ